MRVVPHIFCVCKCVLEASHTWGTIACVNTYITCVLLHEQLYICSVHPVTQYATHHKFWKPCQEIIIDITYVIIANLYSSVCSYVLVRLQCFKFVYLFSISGQLKSTVDFYHATTQEHNAPILLPFHYYISYECLELHVMHYIHIWIKLIAHSKVKTVCWYTMS